MATVRLKDFPAKPAPVGADIIYVGDSADGFDEVQSTISQILAGYSANVSSLASLAGTANTIPYFSALNTFSETSITSFGIAVIAISTGNNGVLVTSNTGVPSISSTLPSGITLVAPVLGTPASGTLTNCTELPISTGVSGLATGVATFLATPSSANLLSAMTTSTGSGNLVFATSPTLVTPASLGVQQQALNMNSHLINNVTDPSSPQDAATKNYVDKNALGNYSVYAASAATLGTVTQAGAGVGATLTNAGAQATFALDGVNPPVGSAVLIKNTATGMTAANEGIYTVVSVGSAITNWSLIRSTDYDTPAKINSTGLIAVQNGTTLADTAWLNLATINTVDTDNFSYAQFGQGVKSFNRQFFIHGGSTTYTPTAGLIAAIVTVKAAGGGAAGANANADESAVGGGGAEGGTAIALLTAAQIGASQTLTVPAGGAGGSGNAAGTAGSTCSFGTLVVATGGAGGLPSNSQAGVAQSGAVLGGAGTAGDILLGGAVGTSALVLSGSGYIFIAGAGGGQGGAVGNNANGNGNAAQGYGAGGSGAASYNGAGSYTGGAGSGAYIDVLEFIG